MLRRLGKIALPFIAILASFSALAQQSSEPSENSNSEELDEVIVDGIRSWDGHEGMAAFTAGDFEKAEFEFEREFISLRRAENAKYNAGVDAALGIERAQTVNQSGVGGFTSTGSGGNVALSSSGGTTSPNVNVRLTNKGAKGRNLLNDGKVNEKDFAFTKYMAGLSELKLGKYKEAKKSLKWSIGYYGKNYDARMRLGLIYVLERDYDKAAKQLEVLEKQRAKCKKKNCDDYDKILESASILAKGITDSINQKHSSQGTSR